MALPQWMHTVLTALILISSADYGIGQDLYDLYDYSYADDYEYSPSGDYFKPGSEYCNTMRTCEDDGSKTSYPGKSCYCDEICSITNDCCQGFVPTIDQSLKSSQMTCITNKEVLRNIAFGYLMVDKCSTDFRMPEIVSKCEDISDTDDISLKLPVTSNRTTAVYKNMYCAFCNDEFDILQWHVQILCPHDVVGFMPDNTSQCDYIFWPPRQIQTARKCPNRYVGDTCPADFGSDVMETHIKQNCSNNGVNYVYVKTSMYKNEYCAKCNHMSEEVYCEQQEFNETGVAPTIQPRYSFRMLIDFNSNQAEREGNLAIALPVTCGDDEIFDPYTNQCRTIYCWPPREASKGKCVLTSNLSLSSGFMNGTDKNCTFVKYTQSEFRLINDSSVFIIPLEKVYFIADVFLQDTAVFICADENQTCVHNCNQQQVMFDFDETEQILSLVTLIISVVSLLVTFTVYVSFPVLLNTPGKILVCLIVSLFFAQITFLVAEPAEANGTACSLIAVMIHFFYLSAFCWVNIIALDLWMTFSKQFISAGSESKSSKRMYYYCTYAWGCPLVIVITALIVDNVEVGSQFDSLQPLYGRYSCWIGSNHALLLFFAGPAALSQLFNLISFVFTSCHIARANRHGAMARGQANTCTLLIIFKLSLVMGLTWVFALVASVFNGAVTWYIFICLNGLQGLYICICFVCTKKVIRLLKQKVEEISQTRSSATQMTSLEKTTEKNRSV